jgi:RNA polymerase sigma-70 factor, ECF subfamily
MISPDDISQKTDEELVVLTLKNEDNFLYLMRKYEDKLKRYIQRITNLNNEDTEDVLQDTFIKVYRHLNEFDKSLKFSSWIYRIAHNQAISNFRRAKARPEGNYYDLTEDGLKNLMDETDVEKDTDDQINREKIKLVLNRLDPKYREVLILKFLDQKDYNEISDILKKPLGTVATLIRRAKRKFEDIAKKENIKFN